MRQWILRILAFAALFAWMAVIFGFSAEDAEKSTKTSDGVINDIAEVVVPEYKTYTEPEKAAFIDRMSHPVRKCAHFAEYALLGVLAFLCTLTLPLHKKLRAIAALLFCFLYAALDEWHQSLSPGRSQQFTDVLIDTSGAFVGILLTLFVVFLLLRKKFQKPVDNHLTV